MTTQLHGKQIIGDSVSAGGSETYQGFESKSQSPLEPVFYDATSVEIDRAMASAKEAFAAFSQTSPEQRAQLLETIAQLLSEAGDELLERAHAESALPMQRLQGEKMRAVNQTKLFAAMLREGSWVEAKIDVGNPERTPLPKADIRSMKQPIGPVVVFGASNFPLAISVVGTDTTTALAAGCPVVVKAHPGHPGTCEILAEIVREAVKQCGLPSGIFSMVHGRSHDVGRLLVSHDATAAVAFTGSLAGGRALMDIAAHRSNPIPVYAEMGSINPIFFLPSALQERTDALAAGYIQSVTLGVGQFCTNPGIVFLVKGPESEAFLEKVREYASQAAGGTMLHAGIAKAFSSGVAKRLKIDGLKVLGKAEATDAEGKNIATCTIGVIDFSSLSNAPSLSEEVFGPFSTMVLCENTEQMVEAANRFEGQLTATIHASEQELSQNAKLVQALTSRTGRIIFNGFPTGIEVCHAMHHGGPYPAASHSFFTSIGPSAVKRFVRPVCYQDFPDAALPDALKASNPLKILRQVDGEFTREASS